MEKKREVGFLGERKWGHVANFARRCLFLVATLVMMSWSQEALGQELTLNVKDATLREVLRMVEDQSVYRFLFQSADIDGVRGADV